MKKGENMKLQILVNHFKESEDIIDRFFNSLKMQKGVDFQVLLCSDGGGVRLSRDFLLKYGLNIKYLYLPHGGMCRTRNVLLDSSEAEYIMFCDIDDCFFKDDGLYSLLKAADESNADFISSIYKAEYLVNNEYKYAEHDDYTIRLHGKLFRRRYLIENSIRFPDELETTGDMYFLWLAYALCNNVVKVANIFYIWKHNPNSLTRYEEFCDIKDYKYTVECFYLLGEELKRRKRYDLLKNLISTSFASFYMDTNAPLWKNAPKDYQESANEAVSKFLSRYYSFYLTYDDQYKKDRFDVMTNYKKLKHGPTFENMQEWISSHVDKRDITGELIKYAKEKYGIQLEITRHDDAVYFAREKTIHKET